MSQRRLLPYSQQLLEEIAEKHGTPVFVYDEAGTRQTARKINAAFNWSKGYKNYFAVKATPTPAILRILAKEGMGFDCSSSIELLLVKQHAPGADIFFTSNNTTDNEYRLANELGAIINIDKLHDLQQVEQALGKLPSRMSIRYNPGGHVDGNHIIGKPSESKFGDTREHILAAVQEMYEGGVTQIGIHTMAVSNEMDTESFRRTAQLLRQLVDDIETKTSAKIAFINTGGGLGINYDKTERLPNINEVSDQIKAELHNLDIPVLTEFGRYVTGPHGILLARVTHGFVESHATYLQIDTSINNLPGFASDTTNNHHVEIIGKGNSETITATVTGSMCVNSDRMFKDRQLPANTKPGDLLVVYDTGAHTRAKAHNYNLRPRAGEVLVHPDGKHSLIRRHETVDDVLATVKGL